MILTKPHPESSLVCTFRCLSRTIDQGAIQRCKIRGDVIEGRIVEIDNEQNRVIVAINNSTRGEIPIEEFSVLQGATTEHLIQSRFLGKHVQFKITEITTNRVICSRKAAQRELYDAIVEELASGETPLLEVAVRQVLDNGAFVEIGAGLTGLLPFTSDRERKAREWPAFCKTGDYIKAKVLRAEEEPERNKLKLTLGEWYQQGSIVSGLIISNGYHGAWVQLGIDTMVSLCYSEHYHAGDTAEVYIVQGGVRPQALWVDGRTTEELTALAKVIRRPIQAVKPTTEMQVLLMLSLNMQGVTTKYLLREHLREIYGVHEDADTLESWLIWMTRTGMLNRARLWQLCHRIGSLNTRGVVTIPGRAESEREHVYGMSVTGQRTLNKLVKWYQSNGHSDKTGRLLGTAKEIREAKAFEQAVKAGVSQRTADLLRGHVFNFFPFLRQISDEEIARLVLANTYTIFSGSKEFRTRANYEKGRIIIHNRVLVEQDVYEVVVVETADAAGLAHLKGCARRNRKCVVLVNSDILSVEYAKALPAHAIVILV